MNSGVNEVPRGRWSKITVRLETKNLIIEYCSKAHFNSIDECLRRIVEEHHSGVNRGAFRSGVSRSTEFGGELRLFCDNLMDELAGLLLAHGYVFHSKLLREMYSEGKTEVEFPRIEAGNHVSIVHDVVKAVFNAYLKERLSNTYVISVKNWLKPCFEVSK